MEHATEKGLKVALAIDTPALGDTIAAIPTLRKISEAHDNKKITVFTSKPFLFEGHPLVDFALPLDQINKEEYFIHRTFMPLVGKTHDINGEAIEFRYSNMDLRQFHAVSLGFTLKESDMEMDLYIESPRELPVKDYVIIHPTHTWPTRTWEQEKWQEFVNRLNERGIPVVAIGRDSSEVGHFNTDKPVMPIDIKLGVNLLNDPNNDPAELRWMMNHRAKAVVTMDSGILHIAGTTDVNIIQLGSSIDNKLRAPYRNGSQDYKYDFIAGGCEIFCSSNQKYNIQAHGSIHGVPPQVRCLEDKPTFECHPTVDQVFKATIKLYDVQPKIRIVHLLLSDDLSPERQEKSIESISKLAERGVEYIQVWNERWKDEPPRETFSRPSEFDTIPITPGHYGNFRAFADAAHQYFTDDLDGFIYCEGDAILTESIEETVDAINRGYNSMINNDIAYLSFGDRFHLEDGTIQSKIINTIGDIHIVNKILGAQMVMFTSKMARFIKDRFHNHTWETADIFFNNIIVGKFDMAIFEKAYAVQVDGISAIDEFYKKHESNLATTGKMVRPDRIEQAYITHTTDNYEQVTINLVNSIRTFSDKPIVVYTIDYTATDRLQSIATCVRLDLDLPNLTDKDFHDGEIKYVNRSTYRTYKTLSAKIDSMLDACGFINEWVYLDGDCLANSNVDDLFNWCKESKDYPLATKGPQQYVMLIKNGELIGNPFIDETGNELTKDNKKCLEWPLMEYFGMDVSKRSNQYRTTNILAGNSRNKAFLNTWRMHKETLPKKVDPVKFMPFHEETIYNVLVWQKDDKGMPMVYINIEGPETVEHFFNTNTNEDKLLSRFYKLPKEKEMIKVFHGEKREEQANIIIKETEKYKMNLNKKTLLYLAPHLSTGGMPQFLLARVKAMVDANKYNVHVLEYSQYSDEFMVQRNQIENLLGDNFHTIAGVRSIDDKHRAIRMTEIINEINPDLIHIEECPESFDSFNKLHSVALEYLYKEDQPWKIIETCHNIWFEGENKIYNPDSYMFCTPYHNQANFKDAPASSKWLTTYPIEDLRPSEDEKWNAKDELGLDPDKVHVLNVGLWTPGKNQTEGVDIARIVEKIMPGKFHFHFVGNQAPNFKDYWEPATLDLPDNVTIWHERSNVSDYMMAADAFMFNSTWECNPLALREAISYGLVTFSRDLEQYLDMFTPYIIPFTDSLEENATILLESLTAQEKIIGDFIQPQGEIERFTQEHITAYEHILNTNGTRGYSGKPHCQPRLEYKGQLQLHIDQLGPGEWHAEFWDGQDLVYTAKGLEAGHWYAPSRKWHTDWHVKLYHNSNLYEELRWTLSGKECLVQFDSSSLGDTLAWMGQMEQFKKWHGIKKLLVRTHKNWLFDQDWYQQRGIHLTGNWQEQAEVEMHIGVYYTEEEPWKRNEHKYDWRHVTLAKIATDRLGIDYSEQRPRLAPEFLEPEVDKDFRIVIATQSTAQAKYWNHPTGWQDLVNHWNQRGYVVEHASKEGSNLEGVEQLPEALEEVAKAIRRAELFIGISSGLSWFAWALEAKVVIISGFTDPYVEFRDAIYVNNHQVCHGCWGNHTFDKGDWNWCPVWKGTGRQFECTKTITAKDVIKKIENGK